MDISPGACWGCSWTVYADAAFLFGSLLVLAGGMMLATGGSPIFRKIGIALYGVSVFAIGINALRIARTGVGWSTEEASSPFLTLTFFAVSVGAILISWPVLFRTLDNE